MFSCSYVFLVRCFFHWNSNKHPIQKLLYYYYTCDFYCFCLTKCAPPQKKIYKGVGFHIISSFSFYFIGTDNPEKLATLGIHKTQDENKQKKKKHHYKRNLTSTTNVNKSWVPPRLPHKQVEVKTNRTSFLCGYRNGHSRSFYLNFDIDVGGQYNKTTMGFVEYMPSCVVTILFCVIIPWGVDIWIAADTFITSIFGLVITFFPHHFLNRQVSVFFLITTVDCSVNTWFMSGSMHFSFVVTVNVNV